MPASSDRTITCTPAMWWAGRVSSHCPGPPSRACVAVADAVSAAADSSTPLGAPVDPEVATTTAVPGSVGSSGAMAARSSSGPRVGRGQRQHGGPTVQRGLERGHDRGVVHRRSVNTIEIVGHRT